MKKEFGNLDNVTLIIQTNMDSMSDIQKLVAAVLKSGATVIEVEFVPFSNDLPSIPIISDRTPIVIYGSVSFVNLCLKSERFAKGVFANQSTFTYENWVENYGNMLLNSIDSVKVTTIEQFVNIGYSDDEDIFVRPCDDSKSINGEVTTVKEFKNFCKFASNGEIENVGKNTRVLIGRPFGIEAEW